LRGKSQVVKALEWLKRGAASSDPFDRFANCWRGFNNLFAGRAQERDLISSFLRTRVDERFAERLLHAHRRDSEVLLSLPVIDMRGSGKDTSEYMREFGDARASKDKLVALFMVIYQVRCNLDHGQKSPSRERDAALCEAAYPFVAAVVEHAA